MTTSSRFAPGRVVPAVMMLIAATAVVLLWTALRKDHETRVADIVEAVSYAARSEMARQLIVQFRALNRAREFWSEYAPIPVDQWQADALIEIDHFDGLDMIAWAERDGPRFLSSGPSIALNHVPTDEEWVMIRESIDAAWEVERDTIVDPVQDEEGHAIIRLYLPVTNDGRDAVMIAVIDATEQVAALLEDESPGYDIQVSCCEDTVLYSIGTFDADVPDTWAHGGRIQPHEGVLWMVRHQPSAALASDFRPWALNTVLLVGLALALAIGAIAYHSRRADERARAARDAERQVRALNEELEQRVADRTRELDEALSDLNTISLSVAHDVRTPLNAATLTLGAMRATNGHDETTAAQIDRIKTGLDQITLILDRLLALSRVSTFAPDLRRLELGPLAERIRSELDPDGKHDISVGDLPAASVDETMAHILLTNLIGNAISHAAGANGKAVIEVGSRSDGDGTTCFVRDHGPGIPPDVRKDIFKPGQHGEPGGRSGLGIGLSIAARVVARHGGSVWVEETDGGGATFCFSFQRRRGS